MPNSDWNRAPNKSTHSLQRVLWSLSLAIAASPGTSATAQSGSSVDDPPSLNRPGVVASTRLVDPSAAQPTISSLDQEALYAALATEAPLLARLEGSVKKVARLLRPCVVHIEASKFEQRQGRAESFDEAGSGVVIAREDGLWVLTNRHVIRGAQPNEVILRLADGRELSPRKILADESTDVAILQLDHVDVPAARIADSGLVDVGDFVVAVGSPFGLSHSVTFGIISATGRRDLTLGAERIELQDFFQTDAAINPGNSGGPLVNLRGEVIGLNTAIASSSGGSEGIGFAIPINMVAQVVDQLIRYGQVRRGYLGVSLDPNFSPTSAQRMGLPMLGGALVKTVRDGSPAAGAGIKVGDVISEFDGVQVDDDDHLVTRVGLTTVGSQVSVKLYRGGKLYQTLVTVTPLP